MVKVGEASGVDLEGWRLGGWAVYNREGELWVEDGEAGGWR